MKRPAFQFYPGDWRRDAALQSCSLAARGLWNEMMCIMHDGAPYGHLRVGSKDILPPILARMVGASLEDIEPLLRELAEAEVFSYTEHGTIYSRRMVRDEEVRQKRAAGGVKSQEHPNVPKQKQPKDILQGPPEGPPEGQYAVPSPAVASASASASELQQQPPSIPPPAPDGAEVVVASVSPNPSRHLSLHPRRTRDVGRSLPVVLDGLTAFLAEVGHQADLDQHREQIRDVMVDLTFAYWAKRTHHDDAKLDKKRHQRLATRLRESGDNVHQILYAVDGALKDDNLMGRKPDSTRKYDGVSTIYRDFEQVERLASLGGYHEGTAHPMATKYLNGAAAPATAGVG